MLQEQLARLRLTLLATEDEIRSVQTQVMGRTMGEQDVLAWFAERIPSE